MIFNIQRFSIHDGPGIRTTVFLKGCNLRCFWCHNPESLNIGVEIQFFRDKCISCGNCFAVCPQKAHRLVDGLHVFDRGKCTGCGRCADNCFAEALISVGKNMTVAQVMEEVERDAHFYSKSGGGVTFSGGEPLMQSGFLKELLEECKKRNFHTAVESALNVSFENLMEIVPVTDLFLIDLKLINSKRHQMFTGVKNDRILENIRKLGDEIKAICLRVPVIPGVNDNLDDMREIAVFTAGLGCERSVELLPFHGTAGEKYISLGLEYKARYFVPPSESF